MAAIIQFYPGRLPAALLVALLGFAIIACDQKSSQPESVEFTDDERYLIEAYVKVKRARSYYPYQGSIADSLFADLQATVDTVRVARTVAALNTDPDRWAAVYREIEERLRESAKEKELERSGGGTGAPTQVEENNERH